MSIVSSLSPSPSARSSAFPRVRFVVPKPGIVYTCTPARPSPRRSNAVTVTSSASALSSPPESPITAWRQPIAASRRASPTTWRENTSPGRPPNGKRGSGPAPAIGDAPQPPEVNVTFGARFNFETALRNFSCAAASAAWNAGWSLSEPQSPPRMKSAGTTTSAPPALAVAFTSPSRIAAFAANAPGRTFSAASNSREGSFCVICSSPLREQDQSPRRPARPSCRCRVHPARDAFSGRRTC